MNVVIDLILVFFFSNLLFLSGSLWNVGAGITNDSCRVIEPVTTNHISLKQAGRPTSSSDSVAVSRGPDLLPEHATDKPCHSI